MFFEKSSLKFMFKKIKVYSFLVLPKILFNQIMFFPNMAGVSLYTFFQEFVLCNMYPHL